MRATVRVIAVLCLFTISIVSSQEIFETCAKADIPPMANFNELRYDGLWYVQEMYENEFIGTNATNCYTTLRAPIVDGNMILLDTVINLNLDLAHLNRTVKFNGIATFNKPGYGQFVYASQDTENVILETKIISTDYTNYAIEWVCWDVSEKCSCWLYVLNRNRVVRSTTQSITDREIAKYPAILNKSKLRKVKQDANTCVLGAADGTDGLLGGLLKVVGDLLSGLLG